MHGHFFNRDHPSFWTYQAPYMCPCGQGVLVFYDSRNKPEKTQLEEHIESCKECQWVLSWWKDYNDWAKNGGAEYLQNIQHKEFMKEWEKSQE